MKKCDFEGRGRLLIGGVSATVVTLYLAAVGRGALKSCGIDDLDVGLAELRPLIRVGNAYLAELLASGQSTLRDDLLNLFPRRSIRQADSVRRQLRAIGRQVEEEFERGDTVSCDGW